ncbi:MAG TPA: DUF3224 domain-containing protein [Polyangiaceae bacterium]
MSSTAAGTFEVTMNPEPPYDVNEGASIGRVSLKKQFSGDLEATSSAEMIGARAEVKGSAGYVAIERVVGTLAGRTGTFVLQHSGTMTRGKGELHVSVVPDSGTGELKGISGKMTIEIVDGKHLYSFQYTIESAP